MTAAQITLGAEVPELCVILQHGGETSFALAVTDDAGNPADLTGRTATIETDAGETWTAAITGSMFTWRISCVASQEIAYGSARAVLAVTDTSSGARAIWARGQVVVRR